MPTTQHTTTNQSRKDSLNSLLSEILTVGYKNQISFQEVILMIENGLFSEEFNFSWTSLCEKKNHWKMIPLKGKLVPQWHFQGLLFPVFNYLSFQFSHKANH